MTASLWKSLTARFMACGHPLREAECMAAVFVAGRLAVLAAAGYRLHDAERELLPAPCSMPADCPTGESGHCGTGPGCGDRDGNLFQVQPGPALPAGCGEYEGVPGRRRRSSAATGPAAMMRW